MSLLATIADVQAEHELAACAADNPFAAQLADVHGVTPDHFSVPALARLFAAALEQVDAEPLEDRLDGLAHRAHVDRAWLGDLVDPAGRTVLADRSGALARRVIASAERVTRFRHAVDELARLGIEVTA